MDGFDLQLQSAVPQELIPLLQFASIVAAAYAISQFICFVLESLSKRFASRPGSLLGSHLLHAAEGPLTQGALILGAYVAAEVSGLSGIPILGGIFSILAIIWIASTSYRAAGVIIDWVATHAAPKRNIDLQGASPAIKRIVGLAIFSFAAIAILSWAGVEVGPLAASLGIAGLAIALALQDTLGNFFGGVAVSIDRKMRPGNYVELVDIKAAGHIGKIGWRTTEIIMRDGNTIMIPNSTLSKSTVINYHLPDLETAVVIPVSVSYDSDLGHVERVVLEVADSIQKSHSGAASGFKPFMRYTGFASSGVNFNVFMRAAEFVEVRPMSHLALQGIHARFREEGIKIPYPKRSVHVESLEF